MTLSRNVSWHDIQRWKQENSSHQTNGESEVGACLSESSADRRKPSRNCLEPQRRLFHPSNRFSACSGWTRCGLSITCQHMSQQVDHSTAADLDNQQDWATNVPLPSSASATRKRELLIIASVAIITTVMAILPNSTITVVRISVYHQPQVWWPLLKSEPYFLNCPWFLLAGVYTTELNFKFQVVLY